MIQPQKSPQSAGLDDDKPATPENTTARWYHQVSRNVNEFTKSSTKG